MHNHQGQVGPPYNPKKSVTCPECVEEILAYRAELVKRYGWDEWPESISVVRLEIRR
mgnify:CR=1 FL=1